MTTPVPVSDAHRPLMVERKSNQLRLRITTELCPQVMLRLLDRIALLGLIPWGISYTRRPESLCIEVEVDDLPPMARQSLAARLEAVVMVRSVEVLDTGPHAAN